MKTDMIDTPFGKLITSYVCLCGLSDAEAERALKAHAQRWGGCISCEYSIADQEAIGRGKNIWYARSCQVGLLQDDCGMYTSFPQE